MRPEPQPIDIYMKRLNMSTATPDDFVEVYKTRQDKSQFTKKEGYFHPFDGELAKYGVAVPVAYLLWGLSVVPSWAMMLGISFISRTMMYCLTLLIHKSFYATEPPLTLRRSRRMAPQDRPAAAAAAAGQAAPGGRAPRRGAAPGDGTAYR